MLQQSEFRPGLQLDSLESYKALAPMLSPIMGSPDISERQLDGLGGGISSLSKIVVYDIEDTDRMQVRQDSSGHLVSDSTINYTFIQVGVGDGQLDLSGNCGTCQGGMLYTACPGERRSDVA
jgi:2-methylaconitate cis-trans-isomerase PrpF